MRTLPYCQRCHARKVRTFGDVCQSCEPTRRVFVLTLDTENEAMTRPTELARILTRVAESPDIASYMIGAASVQDDNGNTVGRWEFRDDPA